MTQYKVIKKRPWWPKIHSLYVDYAWNNGKVYMKADIIENPNVRMCGDMIEEYLEEVKESKVADSWDELPEDCKKNIPNSCVSWFNISFYDIPKKYEALMKLEDLRNETWRRCNDWKPDWQDETQKKHILYILQWEIKYFRSTSCSMEFLSFSSVEVAMEFKEKHSSLILQTIDLY